MKALEEILQPLLTEPFTIKDSDYIIELDKKNRLKVHQCINGRRLSAAVNGLIFAYSGMEFHARNSFLLDREAYSYQEKWIKPAFSYIHGFSGRCLPNGQLHCEDGPALSLVTPYSYRNPNDYNKNDFKAWLKNGKLHRFNGGAIEYKNGKKRWFLEGTELDEPEYWRRMLNYPEGIKFFARTFAGE